MFRMRLVSAAALISSLVAVVWLDYWYPLFNAPGLWIWPLGFGAAVATANEFVKLAQHAKHAVNKLDVLIAVSACYCVSSLPLFWRLSGENYPLDCPIGIAGWPSVILPLALFGLAIRQMLRFQQQGNALEELAISGLIVLYVGGCTSFWVVLRSQPSSQWALLTLVGIIAVTKLADIGAYIIGKAVGRTKLCPKISPGKTVEGLCGGLVFAALGSWGYFNHFIPWLQATEASRLGQFGPLVLAVILTLGGLAGDLTESLIKRDVGSKDSGNLLPGMGGVWDVTDSLLPAAVLGFLGVVARLVPQPV